MYIIILQGSLLQKCGWWKLKVWMASKAIRQINDGYFHLRLLSTMMGTGNPWTTVSRKMKGCWRAGQRERIALWMRMVHSFAEYPVSTTTRNGCSREGSDGSILFVPSPYLYTLMTSCKPSKPFLLHSCTVPALTVSHQRRAAPAPSSYQWHFAGLSPVLEPVLQVWLYQCWVGGFCLLSFSNMNLRNLGSAVFPPVK